MAGRVRWLTGADCGILARRAARLCVVLLTIAATSGAEASGADDAQSNSQRKLLGESTGQPVQRACVLRNCATVLAVHHQEPWEPSAPISTHGLSRNPPFGSYNPHIPPITQPSSVVQQRKDVWVIEVRMRDGSVKLIEQTYPALFQVGDEVLVDGDRVRAPD